jgi:hypothetical protein
LGLTDFFLALLTFFNSLPTDQDRPRKTLIARKLFSVGGNQHPDTSVVDFAKNPFRQDESTAWVSTNPPGAQGPLAKSTTLMPRSLAQARNDDVP